MAIRQLQPLQVNPKTGEPFLRLPGLLEHIIITPIRETDKPAIIRHLNDQRVIRWLSVSRSESIEVSFVFTREASCYRDRRIHTSRNTLTTG